MTTSFYLTVTKHKSYGRSPGLKLTSKKPTTLAANQIAVQVSLQLPDALFEKPSIKVNLTIDKSTTINNLQTIDATVMDNIAEVLQNQLGVKVHVTASEIDHAQKEKQDVLDEFNKF